MAYGVNLVQRLDDTVFVIGEGVEHNLDTFRMVRYRALLIMFLSIPFVCELAHLKPYTFEEAFGKHVVAALVHIDKLIFY